MIASPAGLLDVSRLLLQERAREREQQRAMERTGGAEHAHARDHGGDEFEAFECHEGFDEGFALPAGEELEHFVLEPGDPGFVEVDGGDAVFHHAVVGGVGELEASQIVLVALGPVGLAVVVVAESAQQG